MIRRSRDFYGVGFGRQVAVAASPSGGRHLSWELRVMNREACVEVSKKGFGFECSEVTI